MTPDPYAPHLRQAEDLFAQGEIVKAGQIWQAVLKQQPSHTGAREGLLAVKQHLLAQRDAEIQAAPPEPAAEEVPAPAPLPQTPATATPEPAAEAGEKPQAELNPRATAPELPLARLVGIPLAEPASPERLLAEGCTLYDMGQVADALHKWEQVLALDPDHALARGYANGARRELGMPPTQAPAAKVAAHEEPSSAEEDVDKLLREAVQLYDMGLVEEAISKWERVLIQEPSRKEVEGYLRQARIELGQGASISTAAVPAPAPASATEPLDLKLRQAEHLLNLQRHEEAAFTFQQALAMDPGNAQARQGLERCRRPSPPPSPVAQRAPAPVVTLDAQGRIAMAEEVAAPARGLSTEPKGIEPPAALLKAAPTPREGPSVPDRFRTILEQVPWLKDPKIIAGIGGGCLVLAVGFGLLHHYRKNQALEEDVRAARAAAVAPVAQQSQAPDLTEPAEALRQEADSALGTDPLRAYLRAETLVLRNPADAAGAQLLEKARAGLAGGVTGASLPEFQKHLQNGDLEAAAKVIDSLLRADPGNADLRSRAARLHLVLCGAHASQAKWDEAEGDLLRGRALFPADKTWQSRLKLLEQVKTMPKNQQASWIALLG
jgi:tetratricopeptide (TPR) repeat protein